MLVVVKKPHIKFDISIDGNVSTTFLHKITNLVKKEYGENILVNYNEKEELIDAFKSDCYKKTKAKIKPGDYIKIYRTNINLTQAELGQKLDGLTKQYISDLENSRRGISKQIANKLAKIFDVPISRFI